MEGSPSNNGATPQESAEMAVRRARTAAVFPTPAGARIAYYDDKGRHIGNQDVIGLTKVELPLQWE